MDIPSGDAQHWVSFFLNVYFPKIAENLTPISKNPSKSFNHLKIPKSFKIVENSSKLTPLSEHMCQNQRSVVQK